MAGITKSEDKLTNKELLDAFTEAERVCNAKGAIEPKAKGLSFYNYGDRPPLEGLSQKRSDVFRAVLGARYAGFTHYEACEMAGVNPNSTSVAISRNPKAWMQCHAEVREAVAREHFINLGYIRTALSEYAPHAIRTLYGIMCDRRNSPTIRRACANDILKMANVDNSARIGQVVDDVAGQISDTIAERLDEKFHNEATIVVDAEYEEEDDD